MVSVGVRITMSGPTLIDVLLPWPVSTNNLWRIARGRNILSKRYKLWIEEAQIALVKQEARPVTGKVGVFIVLYPPSRRNYDPDNKVKAILDLLVNNGLIDGDDARTVRKIVVDVHDYKEGFDHVGAGVSIIPMKGPGNDKVAFVSR